MRRGPGATRPVGYRNHGRAIRCIGAYQPLGHDPHGTFSNYVQGCRCSWCRVASNAHDREWRHRNGRNKPRKAALTPWPGRVDAGGPWLLFQVILAPGSHPRHWAGRISRVSKASDSVDFDGS